MRWWGKWQQEQTKLIQTRKFHIWKALVQQPNKASTSFFTRACHQCLDFFLKDILTLNPFREAAETSGISTFDPCVTRKLPSFIMNKWIKQLKVTNEWINGTTENVCNGNGKGADSKILFFKSHLNYTLGDQKWVEGWRLSNVLNKTTPFIKLFIVRVTWWPSRAWVTQCHMPSMAFTELQILLLNTSNMLINCTE